MSADSSPWGRFFQPGMAEAPVRRKPDKRGFLNLSSNELVHDGIAALVERVLSDLPADLVMRYPYWPAFEAEIADRFGYGAEEVLVAAGSDSAYRMLLASLKHHGTIVAQAPTYEQLPLYARAAGLAVRGVRYRRGAGFVLDDLVAALDCPPTTVWIANPNAPAGWLMALGEVAELASRCARLGHLLIVDEAYADFGEISHQALMRAHDNVVIVRSFSKGWGMAGARLAFVAAPRPLADYLRGWNAGNPVSGVTVRIAQLLFAHEPAFARARRELNEARDWFAREAERDAPAVRALPSAGNFVNLDLGSRHVSDAVAAELRANGILVRSMEAGSPLEGCLRVTAAPRHVLEPVLRVVRERAASARHEALR